MPKTQRLPGGTKPEVTGVAFWPRDWQPVVLGASVTFLIGFVVRATRFPDPWVGFMFSATVDSVVLLVLVPLLALQRWAWSALPPAAAALLIWVGLVGAAGTIVLTTVGFAVVFPQMIAPYANNRAAQVAYYIILFVGWSVAAAWLTSKQNATDRLLRTVAAERAAANAEMSRLRMQLDSHFMFNALNTIAVEIQDSPRQALLLVRELSQYLRYTFDTADQRLVPISAEIAALRSFLRVQTLRFGSQMAFEVEQAGSTRGRLVPPFLVQPLVENATKHGTPNEAGVLQVRITLHMAGEQLRIQVFNSGDLLHSSDRGGTGTGLIALMRRLELHYPGRHHFALVQVGDQVRAELHLDGRAC